VDARHKAGHDELCWRAPVYLLLFESDSQDEVGDIFLKRIKRICPSGKSATARAFPCPAPFAKIFPFAAIPNQIYIDSILSLRGALAIVTNVGAGCGGRGSARAHQ
jgi:hypothetical protein